MELGYYVSKYRKEAGMTIDELVDASGVPKGTINKIISGDTKSPSLDTVVALARALGKKLDDFTDLSQIKKAPSVSDEAMRVAKAFDLLDERDKGIILAIIGAPHKVENPVPVKPKKTIPLLPNSFAAGTGEPSIADIPTEDYEIDENIRADFAIRINGNSMEPYLKNGHIALGVMRMPNDGEVGAFFLDGDFIVKQVAKDSLGNTYLFSLNRNRKDADQMISATGDRTLVCYGTVVMKERVPLPIN